MQIRPVELWQFLQNEGLARAEDLNPRRERKAKLVRRCAIFPATLVLNCLWITSPRARSFSKHSHISGAAESLWDRLLAQLSCESAAFRRSWRYLPLWSVFPSWARLSPWLPASQVRLFLAPEGSLAICSEAGGWFPSSRIVPGSCVKGRRMYLTLGCFYKWERFGWCTV